MQQSGWLMLHLAFWLRLHVILFERACTWTFLVDRNDVYLHHHLFCFMYQCSGWYVRVYVYQACIDMITATRICQQASCHGGPELRSGMFFLVFHSGASPMSPSMRSWNVIGCYECLTSMNQSLENFLSVLNREPCHNFIHLPFFHIQSLPTLLHHHEQHLPLYFRICWWRPSWYVYDVK